MYHLYESVLEGVYSHEYDVCSRENSIKCKLKELHVIDLLVGVWGTIPKHKFFLDFCKQFNDRRNRGVGITK